MNSDRLIGSGILIAVIIVAILYFGSIFWGFFKQAVYIVVSIGFLIVLGIGGWIGWTMASTPSPEPVEDIETEEIEEFEEEEVVEPTPEAGSFEEFKDEMLSIDGMTENRLESLREAGYDSAESIKSASKEKLTRVKGIGNTLAARIKDAVIQ